MSYSPWGHKESDMTERELMNSPFLSSPSQTHTNTQTQTHTDTHRHRHMHTSCLVFHTENLHIV